MADTLRVHHSCEICFFLCYGDHLELHVLTHSFPTRRSSDLMRHLENPKSGVHFIDGVDDLSTLFGAHRRTTLVLTIASYAVVALILQMRYGLRGGLAVMAPPMIAAIASLGIPGLLGLPISLFNIMAQLLVLGIGVDYGVFRSEEHTSELQSLMRTSYA